MLWPPIITRAAHGKIGDNAIRGYKNVSEPNLFFNCTYFYSVNDVKIEEIDPEFEQIEALGLAIRLAHAPAMANTQQSPYANEEYTVGWICALPPEFAAAKGMLDEEHGEPQTLQASADDNPYFLGSIGKFKVVIACLPLHQIGPASAASAAKEMLFTFPKIRVGLLVGIGAGIPDDDDDDPEIHLGDIVISSSPKSGGVAVYDFGKQLSDGSFESLSVLNRPPRSLASGLTKLQAEHDMNGNKVVHYIEQMLNKYQIGRAHV